MLPLSSQLSTWPSSVNCDDILQLVESVQKKIPSWLVCGAPMVHVCTVYCLGFKSLLDWDFFCIQVIQLIVKIVSPCFNRHSILHRFLVAGKLAQLADICVILHYYYYQSLLITPNTTKEEGLVPSTYLFMRTVRSRLTITIHS